MYNKPARESGHYPLVHVYINVCIIIIVRHVCRSLSILLKALYRTYNKLQTPNDLINVTEMNKELSLSQGFEKAK